MLIKVKLNSKGFVHHIFLPIIVIALIALVGIRVMTASHAAQIGTTYYVSSTGKDSNNGTSPSTSWQTIARVNSVHFNPGDSILFNGGDTFSGQIYFVPGESGTSTSPINISSYGTGKAVLSETGTNNGILAYDAAGISISNLNIVGSGAGNDTGSGLNFYNDDSNNTILNYVSVNNVTANGFKNGFLMGGGNGGSGFSNVTVNNSTFHDNQIAGLQTYGPTFNPASPTYVNQNVNVSKVTAYNNYGDSSITGTTWSGSGIVLGNSKNSKIYQSLAYNNGANCKSNACAVGIWAYDSTGDTIEYNQSYSNHTGGKVDGDGFDLDQNTSNSFIEYNYSHDNDGSGYLVFGESSNEAHKGNTIRFNISQNDARKNSYGAIELYGNVSGDSIYNNTVYITPSNGAKPSSFEAYLTGSGLTNVRNNILIATGGTYPVIVTGSTTTSTINFQSNDYYTFTAYWGTKTYNTISSWRSATGQEKLNGVSIGLTSNPKLNNAGGGGTIAGGYSPTQLTAYQPASGSPIKNSGINLTSVFGTNIGGVDYYKVTVPTTKGLSIGAAE